MEAQRDLTLLFLSSAIDWFLDRCITALNITGDTVVSCIISKNIDLSEMEGLPADAIKNDETKHVVGDSAENSDEASEEKA